MPRTSLSFALGSLLLLPLAAPASSGSSGNPPPYATPVFYPFSQPNDSSYSDYRPVLNADGTRIIFERTFTNSPGSTQLYIANLTAISIQPQNLFNMEASRPDWCWDRSNKGKALASGPVAFSNNNGIYVAAAGTSLTLLPNTQGMIYPSWYPDCRYLAVDVGENAQVPGQQQFTAKIDAATGRVIAAPLANGFVWAGFPSVNQVDPRLVSFAGQFNAEANYYDQQLNYTWVTDRRTDPPIVAPMDRSAPVGPGFLQHFQARAGWWSPDGRWFAFESNRSCPDESGLTYAIFIQNTTGTEPPMQVTSCEWNANHPKWFPQVAMNPGGGTFLIAAVAKPGQAQPFHIAALEVTAFVRNR